MKKGNQCNDNTLFATYLTGLADIKMLTAAAIAMILLNYCKHRCDCTRYCLVNIATTVVTAIGLKLSLQLQYIQFTITIFKIRKCN
jgi:hypothetical protein